LNEELKSIEKLSFMNFLRRPIQFEKINQFAYLQDTTSKL